MTKRILAILFAVVLVLSALPISAAAASDHLCILDDSADLLTKQEEDSLNATLHNLSVECDCNVVFLTAKDLSDNSFSHLNKADDYAQRYYETKCGVNTDGLLVYVILKDEDGDRRLGVFGTGKCEKRLSNKESDEIRSEAISQHSPEVHGYYDFFNSIAEGLLKAVPPHLSWYSLPLALLIGFILALIIMSSARSKLKSVKMEHGASNYVRMGSMHVDASRDTYLYSTVTKTAKPKENSSSHSSGGGSYSGGSSKF